MAESTEMRRQTTQGNDNVFDDVTSQGTVMAKFTQKSHQARPDDLSSEGSYMVRVGGAGPAAQEEPGAQEQGADVESDGGESDVQIKRAEN